MTINTKTLSLLSAFYPKKHKILSIAFMVGAAAWMLSGQEVYGVQDGEMRGSVNYLTGLLNNNIVPAMIAAGMVAGAGFGFIKQQFAPLVIAICTTIGYGFARAWIGEVYALCV